MAEKIAHFEILRTLGQGGMGVVYAARDTRLGREVALKMLRPDESAREARERLWREAAITAQVSHPGICQIFEVGEADGRLYIVMELLSGRSLADRLAGGSLPPPEAVGIARELLEALEVLHQRGIIHRDLKPSNVFLTPYGVKLLDFGLARSFVRELQSAETRLTLPGTALGTPCYMAPEQWTDDEPGPACDLFAAGAILFEMLTGQKAFDGSTVLDIQRSIVHGQPPALAGGHEVMALDRVVQRALAKRAEDRPPSAAAMAADLGALGSLSGAGSPVLRTMTRLIVLPLRILRPDPDTDFLAFSIPDALTTALSGLDALVVRPSAAALRYADAAPDFRRIAQEESVDAVLAGSLLRLGEVVRVSTELVTVPQGNLLSSHVAQVTMGDMFQLQETLVGRIADALSVPLSGKDKRSREIPATPLAYEYYLRANQFFHNRRRLSEAADLYQRCLDEDPQFAPAWARLGRIHRVLAKYGDAGDSEERYRKAEEAFRHALSLDPELSLAHNLYTHLEVEELGRTREAMVRLLERAHRRHSDPELFSGLVLTCRFCGLLEASLAADSRARRLDPGIRTSVAYTWWMLGDYERAALYDDDDMGWVRLYSWSATGREEEAIARCRELEATGLTGMLRTVTVSLRTAMERDRAGCLAMAEEERASRFHDPEGLYFTARNLARVGEVDLALDILETVTAGGFTVPSVLRRDGWLAPLREMRRLQSILLRAEEGRRQAAAAYVQAGGPRLFGV